MEQSHWATIVRLKDVILQRRFFPMLDAIVRLIENPFTQFFAGVILSAIALSGRTSVTAMQVLLGVGWLVMLVGLRTQPLPIVLGVGSIAAGSLILLAYWFRPEAVPSYTGTLVANSETLFSPKISEQRRLLEIGDSGTIIAFSGPNGTPIFSFFKKSNLTIESIKGSLKVSTKIMDQEGNLVAELIRNEWKVAPPPRTWDRNYSTDALEVLDPRGKVVLQVKALPDRIQLQGEWWADKTHGVRLMKSNIPGQPGAILVPFGPKLRPEQSEDIPLMFVYPSDLHFGELAK
jgi:hypothetical protein